VLHALPFLSSDFITLVILWSSSLCSLLQPPTISSLLGPHIILSTLLSNTLNLFLPFLLSQW
jgi:hypothetical protein